MEVLGRVSCLEGTRQELEPLQIWEVRDKAGRVRRAQCRRPRIIKKGKLRKDHSSKCLLCINNFTSSDTFRTPWKNLCFIRGYLVRTLDLAIILRALPLPQKSHRALPSEIDPKRCFLSKGFIKHKLRYDLAQNKSQLCVSEFLRSLNIDR